MIVRARLADSQMASRKRTSITMGRTKARRSSRSTAWRIVSSWARFATTNWPARAFLRDVELGQLDADQGQLRPQLVDDPLEVEHDVVDAVLRLTRDQLAVKELDELRVGDPVGRDPGALEAVRLDDVVDELDGVALQHGD